MPKYLHKIIECPTCKTQFINKRRERLQKFCSHFCALKMRHKTNGLKTYNVENWKLNSYSEKVNTCELCGREETTSSSSVDKQRTNKLCKDHDHKNGNFRGMLCSTCNRALGWYENNKDKILEYLESTTDFESVIEKVDKKIQ